MKMIIRTIRFSSALFLHLIFSFSFSIIYPQEKKLQDQTAIKSIKDVKYAYGNHTAMAQKAFELALQKLGNPSQLDPSVSNDEILARIKSGAFSEDYDLIPGDVNKYSPNPDNEVPTFTISFQKIPFGGLDQKNSGWYRGLPHGYFPVYDSPWPGTNHTTLQWAGDGIQNSENVYNWNNALVLYKNGKKVEAYLCLGHILHLLADMSIPAHVNVINHGTTNYKKNGGSLIDWDVIDIIADAYESALDGGSLANLTSIPNLNQEFLNSLNYSNGNNLPVFNTWQEYFIKLANFTFESQLVKKYYFGPYPPSSGFGYYKDEKGYRKEVLDPIFLPDGLGTINGRWTKANLYRSYAFPKEDMIKLCNNLVPKATEYLAGLILHFIKMTQLNISTEPTATITNISVSPTIASTSSTIEIAYAINSTGSIQILLGASFRLAGTTSWNVSDETNDISVPLVQGIQTIKRNFKIPSTIAAGTYDLLVALWKDKNGNNRIDGLPTDELVDSFSSNNALKIGTQSTQYTINLSCNPSDGGKVSGAGTFNSGSNITVSATSNSGYTFANWTENGNIISTVSSFSFTLTSNRTLVANFNVIPAIKYFVNLSCNPSNGGTAFGGGYFETGQIAKLIATSNPGYTFINWTENGNHQAAITPYKIAVGANRNLIANFSNCNFTLGYYSTSAIATAHTDAFWLFTTSDCDWVASVGGSNDMITLVTATGKGKSLITYNVSENKSTSPRVGTITVGGQTFTVTQVGYVPPCSTIPIRPYDLSVIVDGSDALYIKWYGNNTNVTNFIIERSISATGPFEVIGTSGNSFGYRDLNVKGGTTYYYRVKACCSTNCTEYTNVAGEEACTYSVKQTGIIATADTIYQGQSVILTVEGGSLGTGAAWIWRTEQCNSGSIVGTGSSIVVSPSNSTVYIVKPEGGKCSIASMPCAVKTIIVKPLPKTPAIIIIPNLLTDFGNQTVNTKSSSQYFSVTGNNLTTDITITPSSGFEISLNNNSWQTTAIILSQNGGTVQSSNIYVRFAPTNAMSYLGNISISSSGAATKNISVSGIGITQTITLSISGYVMTSNGNGISNVTLLGFPNTTMTDLNGYYSCTVNAGWTGKVTPTKTGYYFSPLTQSYSNVTNSQIKNYVGAIQSTAKVIFYGNTPLTYTLNAPETGYLVGTNSYGDIGKYQRFDIIGAGKINEVKVYFTGKQLIGDADQFNLVVRNCNNNDGPGNLLYSKSYPTTIIEGNNPGSLFNNFSITPQINVTDKFFIGIEWMTSNDDQFAIIADANGEGESQNRAWEKWSDETYHNMTSSWKSFDADLWITAILDVNTSTKDISYFEPSSHLLCQNYPNPFNPTTIISFSIPKPTYTLLKVYNSLGVEVVTLIGREMTAGTHRISWDGKNNLGLQVPSGVYYYSLLSEEFHETRKMILLK